MPLMPHMMDIFLALAMFSVPLIHDFFHFYAFNVSLLHCKNSLSESSVNERKLQKRKGHYCIRTTSAFLTKPNQSLELSPNTSCEGPGICMPTVCLDHLPSSYPFIIYHTLFSAGLWVGLELILVVNGHEVDYTLDRSPFYNRVDI